MEIHALNKVLEMIEEIKLPTVIKIEDVKREAISKALLSSKSQKDIKVRYNLFFNRFTIEWLHFLLYKNITNTVK